MAGIHDPDRHHRRSIRLKGYEYAQAGAYSLTVCTACRDPLFGEIVDDEMRPNAFGRAVQATWDGIPDHFTEVDLDAFVVMPNHVHGILVIVPSAADASVSQGTACRAPTTESFGPPVTRSLATMVRSFKAATTKAVNDLRGTRGAAVWQRNYYERVIRNDRELQAIREYIARNPANWVEDEQHPNRQSHASRHRGRGSD
jgi:putative transposase